MTYFDSEKPENEEQWGAVRSSEVQKTENDKKSIFSYIDMIYIIVKLMTCGLRICICFWAWGSFQPLEHVLENGPENGFFYFFQIICFWKAETKLRMNQLEFLRSEVIWGRERSSKVKVQNGKNFIPNFHGYIHTLSA